MNKLNLFDTGRHTYKSLNSFKWDGPTLLTPWGVAAYIGEGAPEPIATGRIGGFFGVANGRTFNQLYPSHIFASATIVPFDINSEDVISVFENLGGGFVAYGRHDFCGAEQICCPFGAAHVTRISNDEAMSKINYDRIVRDKNGNYHKNRNDICGEVIFFNHTRHWAEMYRGDGNFKITAEIKTGTRAELGLPGIDLVGLGWSISNDHYKFLVELEYISDNLGIFATRHKPIKRVED